MEVVIHVAADESRRGHEVERDVGPALEIRSAGQSHDHVHDHVRVTENGGIECFVITVTCHVLLQLCVTPYIMTVNHLCLRL